jgi:Flp pilus assembly protein TadD
MTPRAPDLRRLARAALVAGSAAACGPERAIAQGQAALDAHDLAEAEARFREALGRAPDDPRALAGLGWTYHLVGERRAAQEAFGRCADVHPQAADCLRGLASVAMAEGQVGRAAELLGRAAAAAPGDAKVASSQALLALVTGDVAGAVAGYSALVERFPGDPEYRLGQAEALLRSGDAPAALAAVEAGLGAPDAPPRLRAMLWQLEARALLVASAGREDPSDCAATAPPVRAWLDAADAAVEMAAAVGVSLPDLPEVRRRVKRRRELLDAACPPPGPSAAELLGGAPVAP